MWQELWGQGKSQQGPKQKSETTCTSSYDKKGVYKISNQSYERCKRSCRDKKGRMEGQMKSRTDTHMDEGHFYSLPLPTSGDKKPGSVVINLLQRQQI